jgi:predicted Zn finger-like uncharacterized protein
MRLICPACKSVYEAPDSAITASGRMVRCSTCGAEWVARAPAPPRGAPAPLLRRPQPETRDGPSEVGAPPAPAAAENAPGETRRATAASPAEGRADALIRSLETEPAPQAATGGPFMAGFAAVALLALAAVAIYARQDDLARAIPAIAGPLGDYAALVDRAREALADGVAGLRSGD